MSQEKEAKSYELIKERIIAAPRELVFKAWTDPKHVAQWWGPNGFTNPVCEIDAKPGGIIFIHMRGPDGTVYPMSGQFKEIIKPERIVFTSRALDENGNAIFEILNTITLVAQGNKTKLTIHATVSKMTANASQYLDGMNEGWTQSLARLEEHAVNMNPSEESLDIPARELSIFRLFNASRELVWKVWTQPEHVAQWWGPNGFTNTINKMDVQPGGEWNLIMHGPDGIDYKNRSIYTEVVKPERLIYSHENGPKFVMTVKFFELGSKTLLTIQMLFETSEERNNTIRQFKADEGLKQNMEKLEAYLSKI